MEIDLFDGCWTRWDRANDHRKAMTDVWNEYLGDHPFDFNLAHRGAGEFVLEVVQDRPAPATFAVLLGEWLYNLRGSLDYLMWATVARLHGTVPPPDEGKLQYPIYESQRDWDRNAYRLKQLAPHHREMLRIMQPFNSSPDANYLGWLNHLARVDRHRRLNTATAYIAVAEPVLEIPDAPGRQVSFQWGQRVLRGGRADLARIVVDPWDGTLEPEEVRANPRVGIDPEIEAWSESEFWRKIPFGERLTLIQVFVSSEIAAYEYDSTGRSRKSDMLKATFRAECDARRGRLPPLKLPVAEAVWSEPVVGRRSTRERFEGRDFPTDSAKSS